MRLQLIFPFCVFFLLSTQTWGQTWNLTSTMTATLSSDGVMTISTTASSEAMPTISISGGRFWSNLTGKILSVKIGNGVSSIGQKYFSGCSNLTSVTMANSVKSIEQQSFRSCSKLVSVELSNSLISIDYEAFGYCYALTSITIPASVTSIDRLAFHTCTNLRQIELLRETPIEVDESFFDAISVGETLFFIIPAGTKNAYAQTTPWGNNRHVNLIEKGHNWPCNEPVSYGAPRNIYWSFCPNGVLTVSGIGDMPNYDAYDSWFIGYSKTLTSIVLENGLTNIGDYTFRDPNYRDANITSVSIPNSVKKIGKYAFSQGPIGTINIPGNVEDIGEGAFEMCQVLTAVTFNPGLKSIGTVSFRNTRLSSIDIPESVTYLGAGAFDDCSQLMTVTVHWKTPLTFTDDYSRFRGGYQSQKTLYVPKETSTAYKNARVWEEFGNIIEMDDTPVIPVASVALDKSNLGLKTGDTYTLKATITPVNATNQTVTWKSNNEAVATVTAAGLVKGVAAGTTTVTATADGKTATCNVTVTAVAKPDFEVVNDVLVKYNGAGGNVVIPNNLGITAIGYQAFIDCKTLTSVEIPQGVTRIEGSAFNSCSNLTSVKLPNGLVSIGEKAFLGCSRLTAIDIPQSVKIIGQWAFFQCTSLRDVTVHWDKAADIPDVNAFYPANIASATLHIPANTKPDYQTAYGWEKFGKYQEAGNGNGNLTSTVTLNHWGWWLKIGETLTLTATLTPEAAANQPLTWTSDNPSVATVTGTGLTATVRAVANGYAGIHVATASGAVSYCDISVRETCGYSLYTSTFDEPMVVGEKRQAPHMLGPENIDVSYTQEWTSSNPSVATVTSTGLITAIAKGRAEIKLSINNGAYGRAILAVIDNNPSYNSSDVEALKSFVNQGDNYQALGLDANWKNDAKWHEKVKGVTWNCYGDNLVMRVTEIDWCFYNITGRLDATPFASLYSLKVSSTNLTEINVTGLRNLHHLACSHIGMLRYLDVSDIPYLRYLFCSGNIFDFSTLPAVDSKYTIYSYAPQLTINIPASPGKDVDLTDYLRNNRTVFRWYRQTNLSVQLTDITEKTAKGKFFIPAGYAGTDLVCVMTNSNFPDCVGNNAMRCRVHVGSDSDAAVVAEQIVETDKNKESVDVRMDIPSDVSSFYSEMRINLPHGIRLDKESLEEYMRKGNIVMNMIEETTNAASSSWLLQFFFDWIPASTYSQLRSSGLSSFLINIPFIIDEQLSSGNYPITISNIIMDFDNGTRFVEPELSVVLTVDRTTAIEKVTPNDVQIYVYGRVLYINTPVSETIGIYSLNGSLIYHTTKPPGIIRIPVNGNNGQVIIVKGSAGWVKKIMN